MRRLKLPSISLNFGVVLPQTAGSYRNLPATARILACEKLCILKGVATGDDVISGRAVTTPKTHRSARFATKAISQRTAELGNGKNASELV